MKTKWGARPGHLRPILQAIWVLALAFMLPWPAAQAAPAFQSFAEANATTASLTIAKPAGVVQNDLLLATLAARGNTTISAPTGWTQVQQASNSTTQTLAVFYRVATAADITATNYAFGLTASVGVAGAILRYTGVDPRFPIDASGIATGSSTTATAPSVTATVADTTVVRIAGIPNGGALTVPTGTTQRVNTRRNDGANNSTRLGVADATQAAAGSTGAAAFTNTSGDWVAATVVLRPFTGTLCANPPGSGTTSLPAGVYNTYYPGAATASAGAVSITLGASRGVPNAIAAGDLLLVIQMQDATINTSNDERYGDGTGTAMNTTGNGSGATNYNNAGRYEFVVAKNSVPTTGGTVQFEGKGAGGGLINTYTNANATTTQGQRRFQVVRVPQYYNATVTGAVTATAWNGASGGIVALDVANTLTFSGGSVNVDALGFRGGGGQGLGGGTGANTDYRTRITVNTNGNKGEGVAGSPNNIYDGTGTLATGGGYPDGTNTDASRARGAPGNAGGGGTDGNPTANDQNSGGGGGGNGGAGGTGGNTWSSNLPGGGFGGAVFPYAANRLALGGGGGSGARNDSSGVQSSGGLGGGIIILRANSITGTATLRANGGWPATDNYTPANDGGGGGGGGGSVLVFARTGGLTTLTITANGGNGANADIGGSPHGPGGGGAGGVIYLSSAASSTSVTGGARGSTVTVGNYYNATSGASGATNTTLTESQIPGVSSGATCKATLASITDFGAAVDGGRVLLHWETAFELGTAGFHVERLEPVTGAYQRLNDTLLPALITSPQGGRYSFVDPHAWPKQTYTYRLVEQEVWGSVRVHGPYTVTPVAPARQVARTAFVSDSQAADSNQGYDDPAQGYQATPRLAGSRNVARSALAAAPMASNNNATGAAQIPVRQNGLFYASATQLAQAMHASEQNVRDGIHNGELELTTAGKDVAWMPATNDAGILFYGEAIDNLYTLDNVYRLRSNQTGKVMEESPAEEKAPDPVAAGDFKDTITAEQDRFPATVVSTDPERDYWYWEGFIGGNDPNWNTKRVTVRLADVADGGWLKVFLKGAGPGSHPVRVSINNQPLGEGTWQDLADYELRLPVTGAKLQSGDNTVEVRALGDSSNLFYLDRIEVNYQRLARAVDDQLTLKAKRDGPLAVDGFSTADIYVFDISNPRKPVHITRTTVAPGAVGQSVVTFNARQGGRYLALANKAITTAAPEPMTAADLKSSRDRVDYLIIAPPVLVDAAQALADYRQGKGLVSRVVGTDEIYDSYNWGIATPHAVREFLRQAALNWYVHHVALVGIGSFDYRNPMGKGEPQAPTLMTSTPNGLFGCDNCLADFDGDGAPDLAIGRIPAASTADLQTYLDKVKAYEKVQVSLRQAGTLLLADKTDPAAGYFSQDSDWVAELLPSGISVSRIYLDQYGIDNARSLLFAGMNQGTGWVNYIGHGGIDRFGGSPALLTSDDMGTLQSTGLLPVISALTCAANRFEVPAYAALGERLLLDTDGGSIAVWAPTGLSLNEPAVRLNRSLFDAVYQQGASTMGEAVQQALRDNTRRQDVPAYMLRIYNLLGDPALELRN